MNVVTVLMFIAVVYVASASRAPYLGGDIQDLIEEEKRSDILNKVSPLAGHHTKAPFHVAFSNVPIHERSDEERSRIARLNARARHRNTYFDGAGGNPFNGGGVLSLQAAVQKKHRRRRAIDDSDDAYRKDLRRQRRDHMPYLGQNLDKLGVVRALPKEWAPPQRKTAEPRRPELTGSFSFNTFQPQQNAVQYQQVPGNYYQDMSMRVRSAIPRPVDVSPSVTRFDIPMQSMGYANMFQYPQEQQQQQYIQTRSIIPNFPAFYNQMQAALAYGHPHETPKGLPSANKQSFETSHSDIPDVAGTTGRTKNDIEK